MKAQAIRELNERLQEQILKAQTPAEHDAGFQSLQLSVMTEIAAQLAEANEHLAKIANPLMEVNAESSWVWLTCGGRPFVVDRNEVTGVALWDSGVDCGKPAVLIGMKGQPWSKVADGTVEEVCNKLKIPIGG